MHARYTIYVDRSMTRVKQDVFTDHPSVIRALLAELCGMGISYQDIETAQYPIRISSAGIVLHSLSH